MASGSDAGVELQGRAQIMMPVEEKEASGYSSRRSASRASQSGSQNESLARLTMRPCGARRRVQVYSARGTSARGAMSKVSSAKAERATTSSWEAISRSG